MKLSCLFSIVLCLSAGCTAAQSKKPTAVAKSKAIPSLEVKVTYSNEEEVYFDKQAKRPAANPLFVEMSPEGALVFVDAFGELIKQPANVQKIALSKDVLTLQVDGKMTELRRANPITCWAALRKATPKPDGSEDWTFQRDLKSHDQGGRIRIGGSDTDTPETIIRMRSVIWPAPSRNRPARVIYIHKADNPDRAVSYSWANMDASRVGINLRWMQTSCTVDGKDEAAQQTADRFKP